MTHTTNHRMDAQSPPAEGVTETARNEAGQLTETSAEAARDVAGTVKEKTSDVTSDVRQEARRLAGQTRQELVGQASQQKDKAADALRSMGEELRGMAEHGSSTGAQLARHGAGFTDRAADFLEQHEPGDLLDEVRGFARRKPGTFLLVAAAAGVVAGRLTRALASDGTSDRTSDGSSTPSGNGSLTAPPVPPVSAPPPTPVAPDPDPGAPVTPRFEPGSEQ
ncbi:CsbD family protein [Kribbella sp. VKM Ac-2566]|uniref:CsbD family protein n=1 Tax=Kribbella sp. VKM Ac-2566 TaxID=2512218 RepID=UPI0010635986|nr:CsbD family protein [Kribbella sp. VKM Ac-2566]TDX03115.1 hypothetical protein EV647_1345 [Kribbella sp. VKM Ac-2566]